MRDWLGALIGREMAAQLALFLGGLACFGGIQLLGGYMRAGGPASIATFFLALCLASGLGFFALAALTNPPRFILRWAYPLLLIGWLGAGGLSMYSLGQFTQWPTSWAQPHHYSNDAVTNTLCAVHLLLDGHNPYRDFYPMTCLVENGLSGIKTTPLRRGAFRHVATYPSRQQLDTRFAQAVASHQQRPPEFESMISYPAGAFVFTAPFVALGWSDMSSLYLACYALCYALLGGYFVWIVGRGRQGSLTVARSLTAALVFVPIILANISLWDNIVSGASEALDILLILIGWATWRRPWLSAIVMGLAVADRQQGWFVALFYAVLIWRTGGWRDLVRRLLIIGGVFTLVNLPFAMTAPSDWWDGVLSPLKDPMFPLGAGLIGLPTHGWLTLWPQKVYTGLEVLAMAAAVVLYWRACRKNPGLGLTLAVVPLFFAWRSLFTYFNPLALLALWPVLDTALHRRAEA